jgi:PQQ-like domain
MRGRHLRAALLAGTLALMIAGCGSSGSAGGGGAAASSGAIGAAAITGSDWPTFNFDAQRSGVGPPATGITAANVKSLTTRRVHLDGIVDSAPIELHAITVRGRTHDVVIVTTSYGRTIAIDPGTGAKLWEFVPHGISSWQGSSQIMNASPVVDPDRTFVYAGSPNGLIHKLVVATGHEIRSGHWPARVTLNPRREKLTSSFNITGGSVVVTTGGYIGDAPPYQGHVVMIDRGSGRITAVWNSLCSARHRLIVPSSCGASDSAIWARSGAVIEPDTGRILVATGNAPFNGRTNWGDSVLELSRDGKRLLHNWTPAEQDQLNRNDTDLGSSAPALLPRTGGLRLAVQGGKTGYLALLNLDALNGTTGGASPRTGGELQRIGTPGGAQLFSVPAVWSTGGRTYLFAADDSGIAAYVLTGGSRPRLRIAAETRTSGTSPVIAGGLLYVFDEQGGAMNVYEPTHLRRLASLAAAGGHWQSPIVANGRVIIAEGNANDHHGSGRIDIFHLPGR